MEPNDILTMRETWAADCHADAPKGACCCCYRTNHHQHQVRTEAAEAEAAATLAEVEELRAEQEDDRRAWGRDSVAWELAVEGLKEENASLAEQVRIATEALEYIQQQADQGMPGPSAGVVAHDALIQMSVVE